MSPDPFPSPEHRSTSFWDETLETTHYEKELFRIFPLEHPPITYSNEGLYRFDDPEKDFGMLYTADSLEGCFLEVFGRDLSEEIRFVSKRALKQRGYVRLRPDEPLHVVNFTEDAIAKMGLDNRIFAGSDYVMTRRWSRAVFERRTDVDGILYHSRFQVQHLNLALFERPSELEFNILQQEPLVEHMSKVLEIFDHYNFGLVE